MIAHPNVSRLYSVWFVTASSVRQWLKWPRTSSAHRRARVKDPHRYKWLNEGIFSIFL